MYLLIANETDSCSQQVAAALEGAGHMVRQIANPLAPPWSLSWELDSSRSASELRHLGGEHIASTEIEGVLVCGPVAVDAAGWPPAELTYVQVETQAALLAWLWSLPLPVVNRYPPHLWMPPHPSLLAWRPLLHACNLPVAEYLISNDLAASRAFGDEGVVYTPLNGSASFHIASDMAWAEIGRLQRQLPVCLTRPPGDVYFACVVGETVVWQPTPLTAARLEQGLRDFAVRSGLSFFSVIFTASDRVELSTFAVMPRPDLDHFGKPAQQAIVAALLRLLGADRKGASR
jgi:hypothetical protein